MDRERLEKHLAMAERHIREGEQHISRQRVIIARLEGAGLGGSVTANIARELLASLERYQALAISERDDLTTELSGSSTP